MTIERMFVYDMATESIDRISVAHLIYGYFVTVVGYVNEKKGKIAIWEVTDNGTILYVGGHELPDPAGPLQGFQLGNELDVTSGPNTQIFTLTDHFGEIEKLSIGGFSPYYQNLLLLEPNSGGDMLGIKKFRMTESLDGVMIAGVDKNGKLVLYHRPMELKLKSFEWDLTKTQESVDLIAISHEIGGWVTAVRVVDQLKIITWVFDKDYHGTQRAINKPQYSVQKIACVRMQGDLDHRISTATIEQNDALHIRFWKEMNGTIVEVSNSGTKGGKAKDVDMRSNFLDGIFPTFEVITAIQTSGDQLQVQQWRENNTTIDAVDTFTEKLFVKKVRIIPCFANIYVTPVITQDNKIKLISWRIIT